MKPLDILDFFDKGASTYALIATYEFDPQFFERRMLGRKTFASAERVVVFMDRGRYQEILRGGLSGSGFNRRYLVVPMERAPGVFHPKLYLALGDKRADGIVGSNNCTAGGIAYNMEICSTFTALTEDSSVDDPTAQNVIRQIYGTIKTYSSDGSHLHDVLEKKFFQSIERNIPWLRRGMTLPASEIELLSSHAAPLWKQLTARLEQQTVRKITVISPFYDREIDLLKRLRKTWPGAHLTIVAQEKYATLAGKKLAKLFATGKKDRLLSATPQPGRRLHAKAFAFETRGGTFWLTGSPNATLAALDGRNSETALWFKSKESAEAWLDTEQLPIEEIQPSDFEAGTDQEPSSELFVCEMRLGSAVLSEQGSLECTFEANADVKDITLRIRNYNEALPALSIPLRGSNGKAVLELTESQIGQIRAAAICETKGTNGRGTEVLSNPVALVQLDQLLRKRSAPGSGPNALQTISETGENLIPYIDSLGSVREAVEFFDHCSIRFHDGDTTSQKRGLDIWTPRDPFKPDTPVNWLNVPAGSSTEDLREAILNFVERHQSDKLHRHVRRGNLNGLPNFLDIFRTLNQLLLTYHQRTMGQTDPVIPFGFITKHIMENLRLLIGPFEERDDEWEGNGFISAILANFAGDKEMVLERLRDERVPQMLVAAVEAMIDVRLKALKLVQLDGWSAIRLRWVTNWIKQKGLDEPTDTDIREAALEYMSAKIAA